jgi:2'-deoxynucleoside 5'-phosphate N-hydrolase
MKIFFTYKSKGSIDTPEKLKKIEEYLEKKSILLSKDIRNSNVKYSGESMENYDIFNKNINLIKESDIVIADVSIPSLGVGYLINYSKNLNKKIICLYEVQVKQELSLIINGDKDLKIIKYNNLDDLFSELGSLF